LRLWWLPLILLLGTSGCDNSEDVNPSPVSSLEGMQISSFDLPDLWVYGSSSFRKITATLELSEELKDAVLEQTLPRPRLLVQVESLNDGSTTTLELQDDGSAANLSISAGFSDSLSGDLIPGDYTYTLRVNSLFATEEGEYTVTLLAAQDEEGTGSFDDLLALASSETATRSLSVAINRPPVLDGPGSSLPDSLYAGFASQTLTLIVSDPDVEGGDAVESVILNLIRNETTLRSHILTDLGGDVWNLAIDSSFAAGISTGDLVFSFTASDRFGESSTPFDSTIWVENTAPTLSNAVAPDTVYAPANGSHDYVMSVDVTDLQGAGDVVTVFYTVLDPSDTLWESPGFILADNGIDPDDVAGDGTWTAGISVSSDVSNFGEYTFTFYGEDRAGNRSDGLATIIVMEPEE